MSITRAKATATILIAVVLFLATGCPDDDGDSPVRITSVEPDSGAEAGGTLVKIWGKGFKDGAVVTFGGEVATFYDYVGIPHSLHCKTPPATAGTVDVTVTNPDAQSDTLTDGFTHIEVVVADFSAAPLEGTAPLNVAFTNLSSGLYSDCCWEFGDGTGDSTQNNPVHSYNSSGVYSVTLTLYRGTAAVSSETKTDYIVVYEGGPSADFIATPRSGDSPLDVAFTDNSSGNITSYFWSFGDDQTSSEQNPVHTYNTAGAYDISLTVTGPGGLDIELKVDYILVGSPPPEAEFSAVPRVGESPLSVKFTDKSTGAITDWLWAFGDGETSADQNPTHIYTGYPDQVFTVSLTVSGTGGEDTATRIDYIALWGEETPDKPVIYLYRDEPALEDVSVIFSGCATRTIPEVPLGREITWYNLYLENGKISYKGEVYNYLFYEGKLDVPLLSDKGWILQRNAAGKIYLDYVQLTYDKLRIFFGDELRKAGLFEHEVADFLEYWLDDSQRIFFGKDEFTFAVKHVPPYQLDQTMQIVTKNSYDSIVRVQFLIEPVEPGTCLSPPVYPDPECGTNILHEWGVVSDGRLGQNEP